MVDEDRHRHADASEELLETVARKEERKLRSRHRGHASIAFGLGLFGIVGWSVAIPTVAGIALGLYLDRVAPAGFSWTLSLLVLGVVTGAMVAWQWLQRLGRDDASGDGDAEAEHGKEP